MLRITADRLFDGTGTATLHRPVVEMDCGHIRAVQRGPLPPQVVLSEDYHFPGCTILPGLIDTHVHLVFSAADTNEAIVEQVARESDEALLQRALQNAQAALRAGLTTLRDCGGKGRIIQEVR